MRNNRIFVSLVALLTLSALPLAACTKEFSPANATQKAIIPTPIAFPEAAEETDWRKADLFAKGAVTGEISVLYSMEEQILAFYRDAPQQQPVLTLDLSAIESPAYSAETLAFADKNGDGCNDLVLPLQGEGSLIYLWDMDANAFSKKPLAAEGLWLTIGAWPVQAVYLTGEENEEGVASHTWHIPDGPAFVLERLPSVDYGVEAVQKVTADFEALPPSAVAAQEDNAIGDMLTYPAYRLRYHTEGDGGFSDLDVYVQTDEWDFRLHVVTPQEEEQVYLEQIEAWIASLVFQETNLVATAER